MSRHSAPRQRRVKRKKPAEESVLQTREIQRARKRLVRAQGGRCAICGEQMALAKGKDNTATVDHIVPVSKGGTDNPRNLRATCLSCNNQRGAGP